MTRPVLERYQRYLFLFREQNDEALSDAVNICGWCR